MSNNQEVKTSKVFDLSLSKKKLKLKDLLLPYSGSLFVGCFLLLITNGIFVMLPTLINGGVTLIEKNTPFEFSLVSAQIRIPSIHNLIAAILLLAVLGAIVRTLSRMVIFNVGRTIERDVRARLYYHVSAFDDSFYAKHSVGDIMNHMTTDVTNIRLITGFAALNIMNIVFMFCLTVPMLVRIDGLIAICALMPFPMVMLATSGITKRMFHATKNYQERLSDMVDHIQENLLGAHVVRLFHQQEGESKRFLNTNKNTFKAGVELAKVRVLMFPLMRMVIGLALGLVLYVGGQAIISGRISVGDFVEVNARILQLAWPAISIGFVMSIYSRGQASIYRINEMFSQTPQIKDGDFELRSLSKVEVHNLILNPSLKKKGQGVSFSLKEGQILGVVGESGSYKSTLLKAIYRRTSVPLGCVFFDEHDINNLSLTSVYHQVAVVSQEPFLFHQSIKDNICFAAPNASIDEVNEVVRIVRLTNDISGFSKGLDTLIGERGITLSGGQRQRVALARALLQKRPLLVLDDALSAVDAETERHIIEELKNYLGSSMVIIATHRLAALKSAKHIIVLDDGLIKEQGTHEQLLRQGTLYQELWGFNELGERLS